MPDLICIRILMKERNIPNYCTGRKESICCVECREERDHKAVLEYYREDLGEEVSHCEIFPEWEGNET